MDTSSQPEISVRDFAHRHLLECTNNLIGLCRSDDCGPDFQKAHYEFLWCASLADTKALEAAYDLMRKDGACYEMPIDSNAVFGRILIMAIAPTDPEKATEAFETLIKPYADPGEADFIEQVILKSRD